MASFDQKLRTLYLMEILLERTDSGSGIWDQYGQKNNLYRDGDS